ncbi:phosphoserine phosphatase SerB [Paeniglutamicibacter sp. Y32M11]|uniref:phosphoserine phosphatase SerB n=1 Tax=Paeniglutamicibacter sp. Y32M11 TaxID=2853258 RepID=UPI00104F53F2|nr:phosphoserine phosphatase SerB [Paeniglutamicibacter sp. Y32M11]QXQ08821.1 phosphoserine phosphatase SerB [Paeniglutamicibacter sp. Y32M11]
MQPTAFIVFYSAVTPCTEPASLRQTLAAAGHEVLSEQEFAGPGRSGSRWEVTGSVRQLRALVNPLDAIYARSEDPVLFGTSLTVVPAELVRAKKMLLVMDVDSTLIKQEVIELLAAHAGREAEVAAVTESAMRGELDFAASLHARVATLAGLDAQVIDAVRARLELSDGAADLVKSFKEAGHHVAVVSGGFAQILDPLAADLGLDRARANDLVILDGQLTGKVNGEVVDRACKEVMLRTWARELGVEMEHTIAAGDGANDLDMVGAAGLGVAFNAKPLLRDAADARIDLPRLDIIANLVGLL